MKLAAAAATLLLESSGNLAKGQGAVQPLNPNPNDPSVIVTESGATACPSGTLGLNRQECESWAGAMWNSEGYYPDYAYGCQCNESMSGHCYFNNFLNGPPFSPYFLACKTTATGSPTNSPSNLLTTLPTQAPTSSPTSLPTTISPTATPTTTPTQAPTSTPTQAPTSPGPWSLDYIDITTSFSAGASNEIEVNFIVGAGREVSIALYKTCDAEGNEISPGAIFSRTVTDVPEKSNLTHSMKTIGYNFNKNALIGSLLWNSATDTLSYCQVTSLVTTGSDGAEWVIMEDRREIEIQFDLEANFIVNVALADETIESANETVSFDDQVKAFKCQGESTGPFVEDDAALSPNTELVLCVISENDSVNLAELKDMVIEQDNDIDRRVYVVDSDGNIVIPAITNVDVLSAGIMVTTRVPLDKFIFETGENITISGKVELDLTTGRRLRAMSEDNAVAAELEEVGYTVTVNLLSEGDGIGEVQAPIGSSDGYTISGNSLGALGLMILAVIGLVM